MTRSWQSLAGSAAMRNQLHRRLGRRVQRTYCSLPQHNSRRRLRHVYAETTRDIGAPTWINGAIERDTSAMRDSKSPIVSGRLNSGLSGSETAIAEAAAHTA